MLHSVLQVPACSIVLRVQGAARFRVQKAKRHDLSATP